MPEWQFGRLRPAITPTVVQVFLFMKEIKSIQGVVFTVDDEDYDRVSKYRWRICINSNSPYAKTTIKINGKFKTIQLHRWILGLSDRNIFVDHIDCNKLNNCKSNLRLCNRFENSYNRVAFPNTSSKYKGVFYRKAKTAGCKEWVSYIRYSGNRIYLGSFNTEKEAAFAYNEAAIQHHKEFARLNIIN